MKDINQMNLYGRGYWRMNSNLLGDEDIKEKIVTYYANLKNRNSFHNLSFWWNNDLKNGIRRFFKNESFNLNRQINSLKSFYYKCFNDAVQYQALNIDVTDELNIAKSKLMDLEQSRLNRFDFIKTEMLALFNNYLINGEYSPALFTSGIITLIPKKGNKFDLDNQRPISTLNTD